MDLVKGTKYETKVKEVLGEETKILGVYAHGSILWASEQGLEPADIDVIVVIEGEGLTIPDIGEIWQTELGSVNYRIVNASYYKRVRGSEEVQRLEHFLSMLYIENETLFDQEEDGVSRLWNLLDSEERSKDFHQKMLDQEARARQRQK